MITNKESLNRRNQLETIAALAMTPVIETATHVSGQNILNMAALEGLEP
jgi:hypothetical protein